jgi:hypothetical protein
LVLVCTVDDCGDRLVGHVCCFRLGL